MLKTGIKEATIKIAGTDVNVAVVHGSVHLPELFKRIKEGKKQYHFIEVMACTGGCINGGDNQLLRQRFKSHLRYKKFKSQCFISN